MKLEYLILLIFAIAFYFMNIKDYKKEKERKRYIEENLKVSSRIITKSGIIAYVTKIDGNIITIVTGDQINHSYIEIDKSYIDNIL
uniref:preprotein translocase subunit YajC n=1 Tax=Anaerococcus mediterraneensis TaxID=1870984 RepID=UPI0009F80C01|nr:preprotein translocase subunit YajC [Anaerococcus mediterraneensis]